MPQTISTPCSRQYICSKILRIEQVGATGDLDRCGRTRSTGLGPTARRRPANARQLASAESPSSSSRTRRSCAWFLPDLDAELHYAEERGGGDRSSRAGVHAGQAKTSRLLFALAALEVMNLRAGSLGVGHLGAGAGPRDHWRQWRYTVGRAAAAHRLASDSTTLLAASGPTTRNGMMPAERDEADDCQRRLSRRFVSADPLRVAATQVDVSGASSSPWLRPPRGWCHRT